MIRKSLLVVAMAGLTACAGNSSACTPELCSGCCSADGVCQPGDAPAACGTAGFTCLDCTPGGMTCVAGACMAGGTGGGMQQSCDAPLTACGADCVDPQSDAQHCGDCTTACTGGAACSSGQCVSLPSDCTTSPCPSVAYYCDFGSKQCKAGCVSDAACTGTQNKCDTASRTCTCQLGSCGAGRYCSSAGTCADGCEQNSQCSGELNTCNTTTHVCGCGPTSCAGGRFCGADGTCKMGCGSNSQCTGAHENTCDMSTHTCECNSGFHTCSGQCVDSTSPATCGSSCSPCAAPPAHASGACLSGSCGFVCDAGWFRSGSQCYAMQTLTETTSQSSDITCRIDASSNTSSCSPYITSHLPDLVYLAADDYIVCALSKSGAVSCAGSQNYSGDMGTGLNSSTTFVQLANLPSNVVKLSLGYERAYALTATGDLWRWGTGWQVRDGNDPMPWAIEPAPMPISWGSGYADVAVGHLVVCTLKTGSPTEIACSGGDSSSSGDYSTRYVAIPQGVTLTSLAFQLGFGCALDVAGVVHCWGQPQGGVLGYTMSGTTEQPLLPVPSFPPAGRKAVSIAVSGDNACAALDNGDLYCWGYMGAGNVATPTPQKMTAYPNTTSVAGTFLKICPSSPSAYNCFNP
jgi:hypothetical protein